MSHVEDVNVSKIEEGRGDENEERDTRGEEKGHTLLGRSMNRSAIKRPLRQG
jgi:hypothetical protein